MTPIDILYIVLAFCVLWLSGALFWLIWQLASILRNVNETVLVVQDRVKEIESSIAAMKARFEHITSSFTFLGEGLKKVLDYALEKKKAMGRKESSTETPE